MEARRAQQQVSTTATVPGASVDTSRSQPSQPVRAGPNDGLKTVSSKTSDAQNNPKSLPSITGSNANFDSRTDVQKNAVKLS